eukprot:7246973-Pyramimonas_sp.AAC.2
MVGREAWMRLSSATMASPVVGSFLRGVFRSRRANTYFPFSFASGQPSSLLAGSASSRATPRTSGASFLDSLSVRASLSMLSRPPPLATDGGASITAPAVEHAAAPPLLPPPSWPQHLVLAFSAVVSALPARPRDHRSKRKTTRENG